MLTKTPQEICRNPTNKNLCKTTKILPTALAMMTTSTTTISMTTTTMITTTITTPKVYSIMIPTATIKKATTAGKGSTKTTLTITTHNRIFVIKQSISFEFTTKTFKTKLVLL